MSASLACVGLVVVIYLVGKRLARPLTDAEVADQIVAEHAEDLRASIPPPPADPEQTRRWMDCEAMYQLPAVTPEHERSEP